MYSATWARTTRFSNMGPKPKICIQGMYYIFIVLVSGSRCLSWLQHYMFVFRPTLPVRARPSHIWCQTQVSCHGSPSSLWNQAQVACLGSTISLLVSGSGGLSWIHHLPFGFRLRLPVMLHALTNLRF